MSHLSHSIEPIIIRLKYLMPVLCIVISCQLDMHSREHQVRRGDSLESIASLYGTTPEEIMRMNRLADRIHVGLVLQVPETPQKRNTNSASSMVDSDFSYGETLYSQKEYKKAAKSFGKSIKRKPTSYAYYNRGLCYFHMEKWRQASEDFSKVVYSFDRELPEDMMANAEELLKVSSNNHAIWAEKRDNTIAAILGTVVLASASVATAAAMADSGVSLDAIQPMTAFSGTTSTTVSPASVAQIPYDPNNMQGTYEAIMNVTAAQMQQKENDLVAQCRYMYQTNFNREPTQMEIVQFLNDAYGAENETMRNSLESSSSTDYKEKERQRQEKKREILNRVAGEKCLTCKGTGKCHACGGDKIAEGLGNSYYCTVCGDDGLCPSCKGTGLASWNR